MDVEIDHLRLCVEREVPHELLELGPREHLPSMLQQARQQIELLRGQLHLLALDVDAARARVERHGSMPEDRYRWGARGAPRKGIDPSQQLIEGERFDEIVVGSTPQAVDP